VHKEFVVIGYFWESEEAGSVGGLICFVVRQIHVGVRSLASIKGRLM
jgi:hypothetical protein